MKSIAVSVIALAVLLAGCGKQAAEEKKASAKPRVALVMKSLANEFFKTMEDGARKHNKKHASEYELICNGIKDELDVAKQIDVVQQMIAQHVEAIVLAPADSKALVSTCQQAQKAGIVVVNIDNKLDADALRSAGVKAPFVGPDNRKGARLAAEVLALKLRPGDKVAVIEGAPNAYNATQRKLGFEDAMKAAKANIVTSQSGYWEMDKANKLASNILAEHPDIKGLLCANDNMALGAVAAVRAAGKAGKIDVVGFDNISAAHELVTKGELLATVDQHADKLAIYGIEYALHMIEAKANPKAAMARDIAAPQETPVDLITAEKK